MEFAFGKLHVASFGMFPRSRVFKFISAHVAQQSPIGHDQDAVTGREQFIEFRRNHDDGFALPRQFANELDDFRLAANIDARCGFIKNSDARIRGQPFRKYDFLLIAA